MWVKICGNTNLKDAALAAELGADAVGFIFAESKRQVTIAQVAAITPHLPESVERVGVFYSHDPDEIEETVRGAGLDTVQLHGGLDEPLIEVLARRFAGRVRMIQTLHWIVGEDQSAAQLADQIQRVAKLARANGDVDRVLIDSKVGSAGGGTGVAFDWAQASAIFQAPPDGLHLIVAGGLKPANVGQAIDSLMPWGLDVCSGVETAPGHKDPEAIAGFIENARGTKKPG